MEERRCQLCDRLLDQNTHGNRKMHPECAYQEKKERQKENYPIGNPAKLMIQKNEKVAALLHKMDPNKNGISYVRAMELGLKFNCPTTKQSHLNRVIHMMDQYGYSIENNNHQTLIYLYHVSELK